MVMNTREDILRMFRAGVNAATIADQLELPMASVIAILLREGVSESQLVGEEPASRYGASVRKLVVSAYKNWTSPRETCKDLGMSLADYYLVLAEEGVAVRRWKAKKDLATLRLEAEVIAMYKAGAPLREIRKATGLPNLSSITFIMDKYNVPRRQAKICSRPRTGPEIDVQKLLEEF